MLLQREWLGRFWAKVDFTGIAGNLRNQFFLTVRTFGSFLFMVIRNHLLAVAIQVRIEIKAVRFGRMFGRIRNFVIGRVVVLTIWSGHNLRQKLVVETSRESLCHPKFFLCEGQMIIIFVNATLHSLSSRLEFLL